ncbi:Sec-independent protein translocase TatB [Kocuria coralli]|uniref:Sec-independent protein translocase TatB n=1 Tax=Kocuria coralli TaxID=1461025 RepID=A0A5J5L1M6_9MICC|nr:twin-arginine translocase TatA/TatE family subunit [Kocuria coralli]KAA9395540.1 Sec-independent protein translocase TatB [Kocuria coralli]
MFGISGAEAIVLIVVALLVIGPERLPEYAQKLKDLVKTVRRYASGAKDDLRETLGPEVSDVDWRKLDPRQYDPRTIVREALAEVDQEDAAEKRRKEREDREAAREARKAGRESGQGGGGATSSTETPSLIRLAPGQRAPFDSEST